MINNHETSASQTNLHDSNYARKTFLMLTSFTIFCILGTYGITKLFDSAFSSSQAILIIIGGILGIFFSLLPIIIRKIFKIKIAISIQLLLNVFMIFAFVFGEAFLFYYTISWWDTILHFISAFGISYIAYCFINYLLRSSNFEYKRAFCLVGAICISLATGLIWEVLEFTIDTLFKTNMQKILPENELFFNGGNTNTVLKGTIEEIGNFFRSPEGYRYALIDTMLDLVFCLFGTALFFVFYFLTKGASFYETAFSSEENDLLTNLGQDND